MYFSTDRNILNLQKILDHFCPLWLSICYQIFIYWLYIEVEKSVREGVQKGVQIGGPRFVPSPRNQSFVADFQVGL